MTSISKEEVKQIMEDDMLAVAKDRDREAFTRLFNHYLPLLKSFCLSSSPGATLLANEVSQEVLIKVWKKAHTFDPKVASVTTWIYTLARNTRIDYLRKNGRYMSDIDPEYVYQEIEDESADPFNHALQKRNEEMVAKVMGELPENQKEVLTKVYLEGKTHDEVSKELKLPLGTVKSRVRLALKKLAIRGN